MLRPIPTRPLPPMPSAPRQTPPLPRVLLPVDKVGRTIPAWLSAAWNGRDELMAMAKVIKGLRMKIEAAQAADNKTMKRVSVTTMAVLMRAERELREAMPHALCPYCQGADGGCKVCHDGFVSKTVYDAAIPDKMKT